MLRVALSSLASPFLLLAGLSIYLCRGVNKAAFDHPGPHLILMLF
jgi:hypothetical protein